MKFIRESGIARIEPAHFQLMYGPLLGRREQYPELVQAGTASFALLRNVVLPLLPADRSDELTDDMRQAYDYEFGGVREPEAPQVPEF